MFRFRFRLFLSFASTANGLACSSAQHARFLERRIGARAARIGIEAERQRVGQRSAEVDRRAVMEHDIEIALAKLDLLVRPPTGGSGTNIKAKARRYGRRRARR